MCTTIALLSGKGGSGKTTLALSIADLLNRSNIRTLLIDCDLSTNGATYFYETRIANSGRNSGHTPLSFVDIFSPRDNSEDMNIFKISESLHFIPSIIDISNPSTNQILAYSSSKNNILFNFLSWCHSKYDVVIFDCQAGYTEFLQVLLPLTDIDLFVLEADSISASAMRSLHLKIGPFLGHARLYQVFNKATPEEFEIYSKIVGTFFTNIGTLLFDWKIRQAFSRSQVPDIANTSAHFGLDLCSISNIILPDRLVKEKIKSFSDSLLCLRLEEERQGIEDKLFELSKKPSSSLRRLLVFISFLSVTFLFPIYIESITEKILTSQKSILLLLIILFLAVTLVGFYFTTNELHESRKKRLQYERELKKIDAKLNDLSPQNTQNTEK